MVRPTSYEQMTPAQKLRAYWHDFCDADPVPPDFVDDMEKAGFIDWRAVTARDVREDPFAADRGIEIGGGIWELTDSGRAVLKAPDFSKTEEGR